MDFFPHRQEIIVETEDAATRILWKPLFRLIAKISDRIHVIQPVIFIFTF